MRLKELGATSVTAALSTSECLDVFSLLLVILRILGLGEPLCVDSGCCWIRVVTWLN